MAAAKKTKGSQAISAKARFSKLKADRSDADTRAQQVAKLTLPKLYKDFNSKSQVSARSTPYQSTGARCTNSLAARLLLSLFPVNAAYFKMEADGVAVDQLVQIAGIERGEFEQAMAEIERTVVNEIEVSGMRPVIAEAMKHGVATGNFLFYVPDDGPAKLYPQTRFVVNRDGMGNLMEMVTVDKLSVGMLDDATLAALKLNEGAQASAEERAEKEVDLYTHISTDNARKMWTVFQEVEGVVVPGSDGTYPIDACPWMPTRVNPEDGEDYGSGFVWDHIGDLKSLDNLRKAILKGAAEAAKVLWFLSENSPLKTTDISKAESGAVLRGNAGQLTSASLDKFADMSFAKQVASDIETKLEMVFGVRTAIQRSGERVTAEEIRYMASELEDSLGGAYSIIAEEFMLPLVNRVVARMQRQGRLPQFPKGVMKPRIVVGMAALGRGQDFDKLVRYGDASKAVVGEQAWSQYVDVTEFMSRLGAAADISTKGLVKTPEQLQQEQAQATAQQAAVAAAPQAASALLSQPQE